MKTRSEVRTRRMGFSRGASLRKLCMRFGYCGLFVMAMGGAAGAANPLAAPDPFEGRFVGEELSAEVR